MSRSRTFSLVEAEISDLRDALTAGTLTSDELVARYVDRIAKYDSNGLRLNSVGVLNRRVFEEAQVSDEYRASGRPPRPLEGIPYVVKYSFKVEGMAVAAGSLAFADLLSSADSAIVVVPSSLEKRTCQQWRMVGVSEVSTVEQSLHTTSNAPQQLLHQAHLTGPGPRYWQALRLLVLLVRLCLRAVLRLQTMLWWDTHPREVSFPSAMKT